MRIQIQLRIIADDNSVISEGEILQLDKDDDRLEVIGLSFDDAKAVLAGIQGGVVTAQAASFLDRHRRCDLCGRNAAEQGAGRDQFRTAFGTIALVQSTFSSLPLPAQCSQELQPPDCAVHRAYRPGVALS